MTAFKVAGAVLGVLVVAGAIVYAGWTIGQGNRCVAAVELMKEKDFRPKDAYLVHVPAASINHLLAHPELAREFDAKYGEGAAKEFISSRQEYMDGYSYGVGKPYLDIEGAMQKTRAVTGCWG